MKRNDTITIRVRPELKEAFKDCFKAARLADSFENLFMAYLNSQRAIYNSRLKESTKEYNEYVKFADKPLSETSSDVISHLESNISSYERLLEKYTLLSKKAFPGHSVTEESDQLELV